jgi:serine/threonine protein kinase
MISALQHPNLVKLYGCCTEGNQLFLVYEYMENHCLARALFSDHTLMFLGLPFYKLMLHVTTNILFLDYYCWVQLNNINCNWIGQQDSRFALG